MAVITWRYGLLLERGLPVKERLRGRPDVLLRLTREQARLQQMFAVSRVSLADRTAVFGIYIYRCLARLVH